MKKILKIGCISFLGLGAAVIALLIFLGSRAKPLPTTKEALAAIPESELAALKQVCVAASQSPDELRHIGGYEDYLLDHPLNQRFFVVAEGHVVALCLRNVTFAAAPDFSGLPKLKALNLRGGNLSSWPELSPLKALEILDLSDQPLTTPTATVLPPNTKTLRLAGTKIADTKPFATLAALETLDLSRTLVTDFQPLLGLKLASLNLAQTPLRTLPDAVPKPTDGAWEVNLEGTPVASPPGYAKDWPFPGWVTGTQINGDTATGLVSKEKVDAAGSAAPIQKIRGINLPRCNDPNAPTVVLEVKCTGGKARVWLEEPADYFSSPWMKSGKIKGFGAFRGAGYVHATLSPEQPARLRGKLRLSTVDRTYEMPAHLRNRGPKPAPWCDYRFYVEPLDNTTVEGLTFSAKSQQ